MDLHTSNLFRLVRAAADKYRRLDAREMPKPWREASESFPVERIHYIAGGVDVPVEDDDTPVRPAPIRWFLKANNAFAPRRDERDEWRSTEEARAALEQVFGRYLPEPVVAWPSDGVALTELWARQGLGAHYLTRAGDDAAPGERYVSSFEFMAGYEVRDGLVPYGGALYLTPEFKVSRLRLRGKDVRPGDPGWNHAAFVYRSSSLVATTIADHVFGCHYVMMNTVLLATKRYLPLSHPLRHFIAPFHYRTAAINNGGAMTLVPAGGMFHRTSGFTWEQQTKVYNDFVERFRFETFEQSLRRKGVHPDDIGADHATLYPYGSDGLELWKRVRAFVDDAFETSGALASILGAHASPTKRWYSAIAAGLPGCDPEMSDRSLRELLAQVVFTVTGFHEHVGNVAQYFVNPYVAAAKVWPGQTIADRQSSMQLCVVGCITGLPMPKLLEDFAHMMPDDGAAAGLRRFQAALREMQTEIDERNARRALPFKSFSPDQLSCSVSI